MVEFIDKAWGWLFASGILTGVVLCVAHRRIIRRYAQERKMPLSVWFYINGHPGNWIIGELHQFKKWQRDAAPRWYFPTGWLLTGVIVFLIAWAIFSPTFCDHYKCGGKRRIGERTGSPVMWTEMHDRETWAPEG